MPEMPERVYLSGFDSYQGWSLAPCDDCPAYVPESRLREVEAELVAMKLQVQFAHELAEDKVEAMREQLAALRADLRALVPLARLGIVALDDDDGRFPSGDAIRFGVLNGRFEETPVVARARALLRREEEA